MLRAQNFLLSLEICLQTAHRICGPRAHHPWPSALGWWCLQGQKNFRTFKKLPDYPATGGSGMQTPHETGSQALRLFFHAIQIPQHDFQNALQIAPTLPIQYQPLFLSTLY